MLWICPEVSGAPGLRKNRVLLEVDAVAAAEAADAAAAIVRVALDAFDIFKSLLIFGAKI